MNKRRCDGITTRSRRTKQRHPCCACTKPARRWWKGGQLDEAPTTALESDSPLAVCILCFVVFVLHATRTGRCNRELQEAAFRTSRTFADGCRRARETKEEGKMQHGQLCRRMSLVPEIKHDRDSRHNWCCGVPLRPFQSAFQQPTLSASTIR